MDKALLINPFNQTTASVDLPECSEHPLLSALTFQAVEVGADEYGFVQTASCLDVPVRDVKAYVVLDYRAKRERTVLFTGQPPSQFLYLTSQPLFVKPSLVQVAKSPTIPRPSESANPQPLSEQLFTMEKPYSFGISTPYQMCTEPKSPFSAKAKLTTQPCPTNHHPHDCLCHHNFQLSNGSPARPQISVLPPEASLPISATLASSPGSQHFSAPIAAKRLDLHAPNAIECTTVQRTVRLCTGRSTDLFVNNVYTHV